MVTYMGNFMPHLSQHTEPLQAMLKQEVVFAWDEMANASFQKIKDLITKSATKPLRYYEGRKPVTVQVDASQRGLGTCLLQEAKPIAYASKSLTDTETRYANIERELLPLYSLVSSSTPMSWEGPSQWSQTISHWKWYIRRALQVPHQGSSKCSFSYSDIMWPSNTDQGRKCCSQMHWAGAPHELLGRWN